jgi:F0F1-type ATP synthase assembly protein I
MSAFGKGLGSAFVLASTLGLQFALSAGTGFGLGFFLDGRLGCTPLLTILGGLCGAASGMLIILRTVQAYERRAQEGTSETEVGPERSGDKLDGAD